MPFNRIPTKVVREIEKSDDPKVTTKELPLASGSTVDAALCGLVCLGKGFQIGYVVPIIVHMISQVIQFIIIFNMDMYIVGTMEDPYEEPHFDVVTKMFKDAETLNISFTGNHTGRPTEPYLEAYHWLDTTCRSSTATSLMNIVLLCLLLGQALSDLLPLAWRAWVVLTMQSDDADDETDAADLDNPGDNIITAINPILKFLILVLVILPHGLFHLWVVYAGVRYLCYSVAAKFMITGYVKLWLISSFDANFADTLLTANFNTLVTKTSLRVPKEGCTRDDIYESVFNSVIKFFGSLLLATILFYRAFPEASSMVDRCALYVKSFPAETYCPGTSCGFSWSLPFG